MEKERQVNWWGEMGGERERKVDKTDVCVYQDFCNWHTDSGSIDTLRSAGTVWSREAHGHWTQISCRKGRIIRELERIFRNRWGDGGDMCGREREGEEEEEKQSPWCQIKGQNVKQREGEEWSEKEKWGRQKKKERRTRQEIRKTDGRKNGWGEKQVGEVKRKFRLSQRGRWRDAEAWREILKYWYVADILSFCKTGFSPVVPMRQIWIWESSRQSENWVGKAWGSRR